MGILTTFLWKKNNRQVFFKRQNQESRIWSESQHRMGFCCENASPLFKSVTNNNVECDSVHNKHVTFGKVETYEYTKPEQRKSMKKKIQGFLDNAFTIGNDQNLKLLMQNQTF